MTTSSTRRFTNSSVDEEGLIAGEPAYVFLNTNYHKRIIEAHKVDQDTGEPVGKTGFGLYRWIGEGEPDPTFGGRPGLPSRVRG